MAVALVYCGGRKLGFWGNGNDDAQSSNKEKVAKRAGEIKELVKEENYNKLEAFCDGFDHVNVQFLFKFGRGDTKVAKGYLKEMLELIFVSGEGDISKCKDEKDVGFCVSVPSCTFTISFRTNGKVVIIVDDKRCDVTRLFIII